MELCAWSSEVVRGVMLGLSIAVRVRAGDREWIFHCFFLSPCFKVTNTFVLASWPGAYLVGARARANQWVWHRKHVTTVTESVGVAQKARDHSY